MEERCQNQSNFEFSFLNPEIFIVKSLSMSFSVKVYYN